MDAVKFVKEKQRMCNSNGCSEECPVGMKNSGEGCCCSDLLYNYTEKYVAIVEKWSAENPVEHPVKTKMDQLLKIIPNARKIPFNKTIDLCPREIDGDFIDCSLYTNCLWCKDEYWRAEINEEIDEEE